LNRHFYITTPIYYVNDKPHIGHAYCTILADVLRRFMALRGAETYFCTGTDEHGQKVQEAANKRGITPQQHCDELHVAFKDLWPALGAAPDQFIRTTEARHKAVVQRALQQLWEDGLIVPREFEGWYCTPDERFWTEKEIAGGACPACGRTVVRLKEKNYFFLMSRFQQRLVDAITSGEMKILPSFRANEVLGFLREPLQDLCISRPKARLSWGIALPFDTEFVTYVWFDALLNYVTAAGGFDAAAPAATSGRAAQAEAGRTAFETWWHGEPERWSGVHHLLGKDILTTHAVYWPTMLMGLGLPLPRALIATGWWLTDNTKMSKSLGNVVSPLSLKDKYGHEVLRYFLMREMALGQDANFSEEALVRRNNADLANDLGNLLSRVTKFIGAQFGGVVPAFSAEAIARVGLQAECAEIEGEAMKLCADVPELLDDLKLHLAIESAVAVARKANQWIAKSAPFSLVKSDREAAGAALYVALEALRFAANVLSAVMPESMGLVLQDIGWTLGPLAFDALHWGDLRAGAPVHARAALFPKFDFTAQEAAAETTTSGKGQRAAKAAEVPTESVATFDDFMKLDLRIAEVLTAERVPKSQKLLRLEVAIGDERRQILAGIAEHVSPESLAGKRVVVLANLPPRKMMGLESQGMVLAAEFNGGLSVLTPADDRAIPGSRIR